MLLEITTNSSLIFFFFGVIILFIVGLRCLLIENKDNDLQNEKKGTIITEFIFCSTESDAAPETPESVEEDGYIPEGWHSYPTDDHPYVWVASRTKTDGVWSKYTPVLPWRILQVSNVLGGITLTSGKLNLCETSDLPCPPIKPQKGSSKLTQVGGTHYLKYPIQPAEFMHRNNLGYLQGIIINYILRFQDKGGVQDLEKAKHSIDLLIELEYGDNQSKHRSVEPKPVGRKPKKV